MQSRLDLIKKGAEDCDGNTSNAEEATFIVKLTFLIIVGNFAEWSARDIGETSFISGVQQYDW